MMMNEREREVVRRVRAEKKEKKKEGLCNCLSSSAELDFWWKEKTTEEKEA